MNTKPYDVVVVGAGIVGLAATRELLSRRPGLRLAVVDKAGYPSERYTDWALDGTATGPFDEVRVYPGSNAAAAFWLRTDKQPGQTYFQDVPLASTYWSAIQYVVEHGISTGTPIFLERPLYKPLDAVSRQVDQA